MKKLIFTGVIIILVVATTITKNSTKNLDKQIFESKENIRLLQNKYELVLLDFNYLSTPKKLMEYQNLYFESDLYPVDIEKTGKIIIQDELIILKKLNE
tara:strand:+ start:951 stop:1247 length:297 start_codon:yes stop_codon:yes gene_type:complete